MAFKNKTEMERHWTKVAKDQLVGKRITHVRYMTKDEARQMDWHSRPVVVQLEDGSTFYPSQDDEGNGPGSLFTSDEEHPILPVIQ